MPLLHLASGFLPIATLGYALLCAASPFGNCRKCRGWGYKTRTDRRGHLHRGRICRRCHGDGIRIRTGRHLWNGLRRTHHNGTR